MGDVSCGVLCLLKPSVTLGWKYVFFFTALIQVERLYSSYTVKHLNHGHILAFFFADDCILDLKFLFPALLPFSEFLIQCHLEWQDVILLCIECLFVLLPQKQANSPPPPRFIYTCNQLFEVYKAIQSETGLMLMSWHRATV